MRADAAAREYSALPAQEKRKRTVSAAAQLRAADQAKAAARAEKEATRKKRMAGIRARRKPSAGMPEDVKRKLAAYKKKKRGDKPARPCSEETLANLARGREIRAKQLAKRR